VAALRHWTPHEAAFLGWSRLRVALGLALGLAEPRLLRPKEFPQASERPPALHDCSSHCARKVADLLVRQGLAVPHEPTGGWLLPAPSATSVEACWNLVPGFHGRWPELWDLQSLESCFGSRGFTPPNAASWLARCESEAAASPCHRRQRVAVPIPPPEVRVRTLVAEGWLSETPGGLHLTRSAQDALTLLRIIVGARVQLPPGGLDRIGRIRVPQQAGAKPGAPAGSGAGRGGSLGGGLGGAGQASRAPGV
jgi:hypothetical protein